jgi:N-acetylmuramoyl-L-alanine amidase
MWRRSDTGSAGRWWALLSSATLLAATVLVSLPLGAAAATLSDTVSTATTAPRVFEPGRDPAAAATTLHYELTRATTTTIDILDYAARRIRALQPPTGQVAGSYDVSWDGRVAPGGALVQDGGYRFRLTVSDGLGTFVADRFMTKAPDAIFPVSPGTITVAIDPGHGGGDPGAVRGSLYEKTPNLDIALRLRAMLLGAGVNVVMTRLTDTRVNRTNVDWTRDGKVAYRDELASRIEIANAARADVFLVLHNNGTAPGVGGTETWYDSTRSFSPVSRTLASYVQANLIKYLGTQATASWAPRNRGIGPAPFYVLRKYRVAFNERPSEMPGILGESLALGHPYERLLLRSPRGKQAIAEGYYEALSGFFATRAWGARYDLLSGPGASAREGTSAHTRIRVTNDSPQPWAAGAVALTLSAVRSVPWYDGTDAAGVRLATMPLPALAPGQSAEIDVPFVVPSYASVAADGQRTILKADLVAGTKRLAQAGVPPLQQALTITSAGPPPPPPTPSPTPTGTATPAPTPTGTATPSPAPTDTATPAPSPTDTAAPTPAG